MTKHDLLNEMTKAYLHIHTAEKSVLGNSEQEVVTRGHIREAKYRVELMAQALQTDVFNKLVRDEGEKV